MNGDRSPLGRSMLPRSTSIATLAGVALACHADARTALDLPTRPPELEYVLRVVPEPALHLDVELRCAGDADGETVFSLAEDSGGVPDVGSWVEGLSARGTKGAELAVERGARARWTVKHAPGERVALAYSIAANERQTSSEPRVHYGPIVGHDLVHLLGDLALFVPERPSEAKSRIALRWEGLDALGWTAVGVRGPGARIEVETTPRRFRNAPFAAGRLRVHERTVHGRPIHVSIAEGALAGDDDRFTDLAARVVEMQRAFFDDWEYPGFLISVVPIGVADGRSTSLGGTGLTDSFALYLGAGTRLDDPRPGMSLAQLLSHEMFHHWNGQLFHLDESPQTSFWLSEGFTDFFARRLEHRSRLISDAEYLQRLNRSLEEYFTSPFVRATAVEIRERFFVDRDAAAHPYRRGDVIAMRIDHELRKRSAGTQCLDDLMRDLVLRGTRGESISPARFYELVAERVGPGGAELAAHLRAVAEEGALLELPSDLFSPCFALEPAEHRRYELGFDLEATMSAKEIRGVREGSRAHSAGLRDGQKLAGLSLEGRRPDVPIQLLIVDAGAQKKLEWLPQGEPLPGWKLVKRSDERCDGR
jgi:predicted metalloprotease with PDZ domain